MNFTGRWDQATRALAQVDELLVDIAVRIQLSPTMHAKAVDHYQAINAYLDRDGSPLKGKVRLFYPQGSMAIGATIRSKDESDLFDIDLVAEVDLPRASPGQMLDLLFDALNGEPGSRYHGEVRRQTRCVTVDYEDMHLDVTPLYRNAALPPQAGLIPHAHEDEPSTKHVWVDANPWGFAEWFKSRTPKDEWFREIVLGKALARDGWTIVEKAEAQPVPDHEHLSSKALSVVALQLTKRWARLNHERKGGKGRCIPSVALSHSFATNAGMTSSLIEELIHQAVAFRSVLVAATAKGEVVDIRNPSLYADRLTDRWPGDTSVQWAFAEDLKAYIAELEAAKTANAPQLKVILAKLFGEHTTQIVLDEFYKRAGKQVADGQSRVLSGSGAALAGLSRQPSTGVSTSPGHRFYGD